MVSRDELEALKKVSQYSPTKDLDSEPEISIEQLRKRAIKATSKAMDVLIEATYNDLIPTAQKLKAAETILEIAYGKDKSGLRVEDTGEDAVAAIARLISESQFSPGMGTSREPGTDGLGLVNGTGMDDEPGTIPSL